jgi:hypothetical protein
VYLDLAVHQVPSIDGSYSMMISYIESLRSRGIVQDTFNVRYCIMLGGGHRNVSEELFSLSSHDALLNRRAPS